MAKLTVVGGDASINSITVGLGGGQEPTNTALGYRTLYNANTDPSVGEGSGWNTAVGCESLYSLTGGWGNTGVGRQALYNTTKSNQNTAIGNEALYYNVDGYYNTATGYRTLLKDAHGSANVANGAWAIYSIEGADNTVIGTEAMRATTAGNYNTVVGRGAGWKITSGNNNLLLGVRAGNTSTTGDNNIVVGSNQNLANTTGSNQLNIGGAIFGTDLTGSVNAPTGKIGVNQPAPNSTLEVKGSFATSITVVNTTAITLDESHHTWVYNGTGTAATITLPEPGTCKGREYRIVNAANGAGVPAIITLSQPIYVTPVNSISTLTQDLTNGYEKLSGIGHSILIQSDGFLWWYVGN
ncbi:MAG: hypothetical protein QM751_15615 [Paludibacteraceae bacterium]